MSKDSATKPVRTANPPSLTVSAPEVSGRRFLLWFALPVLLIFAALFVYFKPDRPVGGAPSGMFAPPDFFVDKVKGQPKP